MCCDTAPIKPILFLFHVFARTRFCVFNGVPQTSLLLILGLREELFASAATNLLDANIRVCAGARA